MMWKNNLGANIEVAQWEINGSLTIGQVAASQDNIYISAGALSIRNNTTERIGLTAAGILTIKNSAGSAVFTFNSSSGAEFTLPLTLASGGGIYQGTGTFGTPTTGLKIYNSGGIGMIAGYNGGALQWYGNTDGKLYAGAGNVWMDASGLTIKRSTLFYYGLRWSNSSGVIRGWIDSDDDGFFIDNRSNDGTRLSTMNMVNNSVGTRYFSFQVGSGAYWYFDNIGEDREAGGRPCLPGPISRSMEGLILGPMVASVMIMIWSWLGGLWSVGRPILLMGISNLLEL